MSGTSLDGLDIAYCVFMLEDDSWSFSIEQAETIPYTTEIRNQLSELHIAGDDDIRIMDTELGRFFGQATSDFISKYKLTLDFIASHGHTVLHQPSEGITLQIADGEEIAGICGVPVINDFRTQDVKMGGQGAPLVPVGDRLLFPEYDYCLNIGGIANISYEQENTRLAHDICPANMVLNMLAGMCGKAYDDRGKIAASGQIIPPLLSQLDSFAFYNEAGPKSLGREWVESHVFPLMQGHEPHDMLATFTEHIALRIAETPAKDNAKMLISGGGAYNDHLIIRLRQLCDAKIVLPESKTIDFKEAMVFAFLGVLRMKGINNVLGSVTGAPEDHCSGVICSPGKKKASR